VKDYACQFCDDSFEFVGQLGTHIRSVHPDQRKASQVSLEKAIRRIANMLPKGSSITIQGTRDEP